jgi:hypothetical protein
MFWHVTQKRFYCGLYHHKAGQADSELTGSPWKFRRTPLWVRLRVGETSRKRRTPTKLERHNFIKGTCIRTYRTLEPEDMVTAFVLGSSKMLAFTRMYHLVENALKRHMHTDLQNIRT